MLIITFCVLLLTGTCLANPVSDVEHLREYLKVMQSQIDNTVRPCENFGKYACGNFKADKITKGKPLEQLLEKHLINNENPKTDDEKIIRTLYLSCKNGGDITKLMEQVDVLNSVTTWPATKPSSDDEIARLFGYLATVDIGGLFSIDIEYLHKNNVISFNAISRRNIDTEIMETTLEKFGITSEESLKIIEDITNLAEKLRDIKSNKIEAKDDILNNVASLKEAVPHFDWDTYFTTFTKEFDLDKKDFIKKPVQIQDLTKLKNAVEILKSTDSKTVINYIVWNYLSVGLAIDCERLEKFLKPLLVMLNIREENDYMNFFLEESEALNRFETSFSEHNSQLNNPESQKYLKIQKFMYGNYENYLSGKYLATLFSNVEINENTLYKNLINILHVIYKDLIVNGEKGAVKPFVDFMIYPVTKYLFATRKELKPLLYSFVTENTFIWGHIINMYYSYENRTISDGCFPFENKTENYKNMNYLSSHITHHIALQDYLHFINEHENQFKKHTEILTEAGLNHAKAYMLASAQSKCATSEKGSLEDDNNLLWYFKHSKQFSDTWGCVAGDAMNKVCDDSTVVVNFKDSS